MVWAPVTCRLPSAPTSHLPHLAQGRGAGEDNTTQNVVGHIGWGTRRTVEECHWEHESECVPLGARVRVCATGSTSQSVCHWEHESECVPLGARVRVCATGSTSQSVCHWEHQSECVPLGAPVRVCATGSTSQSVWLGKATLHA